MRGAGWNRWALGVLWAVASCTPVERTTTMVAEANAPECTVTPDRSPPLPVVTILQTRDHEVTVHAGPDGLRFTVSLAGGVLLGHQLTKQEFEHSFPGLHQRYDSAFAGDDAWLDASVDVPLGTPGASDPRLR